MFTGSARRFPCDYIFRAEAEAMSDALRMAVAMDVINPIFEGDSLFIIKACKGEAPPWQASSVIASICSDLAALSGYNFNWIPRNINAVANLIAGHALKRTLPISWSWLPPIFLRSAILNDVLVLQNN